MLLQRRKLILAPLIMPMGVWAQTLIDIKGVGLSQVPIALTPFVGGSSAPESMGEIIGADLSRSGRFRVSFDSKPPIGVVSSVNTANWRSAGVDYLVSGSINKTASNRYNMVFQLWDLVQGQTILDESIKTSRADLRYAAHRIADKIFEAVLGIESVFATRIAYVTKNAGIYRLWVADADGQGAQIALSSPQAVWSPQWSPSGDQLAYVSLESRKAVVYIHDVATGSRRRIANFKGSNSAPSWSPDGKELLVTLSQNGGSQLFRIPAQGGRPQRITRSSGIDTEAFWAADGFIYFVSDRGGSPQIYRSSITNPSELQRLSFTGVYNVSPTVSVDGRWLAYVSRVQDGTFDLYVMELATGKANLLAQGVLDGRPSFAPNSQLLLYMSRVNGRDATVISTVDGKFSRPLPIKSGSIRGIDWSQLRR